MKKTKAQDFLSSLRISNKKTRKAPTIRNLSSETNRYQPPRKRLDVSLSSSSSTRPVHRDVYMSKFHSLSPDQIDTMGIPLRSVEVISTHDKAVTSVTTNKKGSIMITGSADFFFKLVDFHSSPYPIEASSAPKDEEGGPIVGSYIINRVSFDKEGKNILVVPNSSSLKIFNRRCRYLTHTKEGDMYIHDKLKTKGHTGAITDAMYHPSFHTSFLTSSVDGTMRLWDSAKCMFGNFSAVKTMGNNKKTFPCSSCTFSKDGKMFFGSVDNGSIQAFSTNGPNKSPMINITNSHSPWNLVSRLRFSPDGRYLFQRIGGNDNCVKIWDKRKMINPLKIIQNLPNVFEQSNFVFIEKYLVVATSVTKDSISNSDLIVIDTTNFEVVGKKELNSPPICCHYNRNLKQLFVGCADSTVRVFYDEKSKGGVLYSLEKKKVRRNIENFQMPAQVYVPHASRIFQQRESRSTTWAKNRRNPSKSKLPEKPSKTGIGEGGKLGTSEKEQILKKMGVREESQFLLNDPRYDLWKVAKESKEKPMFVDHMYKESDPNHIMAKRKLEKDDSDQAFKKRKTK